MSDPIILTPEEQNRLAVINALIERKLTNGEAAKKLTLTIRQVKRLKKKVRGEGATAIIHQLKGKRSNHHIAEAVKQKALELITKQYADFKPTFAAEKLQENHAISISYQTARRWMMEHGIWQSRKHKKTGAYRTWRPRKDYYGEMQQFDGSYHMWFEDRYCDTIGNPIEVCLLLAVDDATGNITKALFAQNEGVVAVFEFWKTYIAVNGKPVIIYLDKFSTYKINHKSAEDNKELMTQFQRVCSALGIHLIHAQSAQAKGRVERMFGTLQDRLVKELRLAKIHTPEEGNTFLQNVFIPQFNGKFTVVATKTGDVHRTVTDHDRKNLDRIFSVHSIRTINNDFTIQFKTRWYQLQEVQPTTIRPKEKVVIEEWLDGTVHISLREYELLYLSLPERPQRQTNNPVILTTHKLNYIPAHDHPWRKYGQKV